MTDPRRIYIPIIAIAVSILLISLLIGDAADGMEAVFGIALFTLFNPLFWIIFLIAVLARRGGGQQQQQQVVIVTGGSQGAPRLRCPGCKGLSPDTARFCGHCGGALA